MTCDPMLGTASPYYDDIEREKKAELKKKIPICRNPTVKVENWVQR